VRAGKLATIEERNTVLRYLAKREAMTPLAALRHAFPAQIWRIFFAVT
jgi:hypothetical protein